MCCLVLEGGLCSRHFFQICADDFSMISVSVFDPKSGYPGVHARVSEAYDWIREEVCRESSNTSSNDSTPEYFGCPRLSSETKATTESPTTTTTNPTSHPPTMAPSIKETSVSPTTIAPTPGPTTNDPTLSISTSAPTIPPQTQFPTPVPTTSNKQPTDVPTSYSTDEVKIVFIESPTFAPTIETDVAVPLLVVEEPL